jgi:RNA polymerase sigma factor (sigma-70 family)
MSEDQALLHRFVEARADEAFKGLVERYLGLVYGTALRRVGGDAHLAQDVTQTVFVSLARKASLLRGHPSLAGWLYVSTHRATAQAVRGEQRRKRHETFAHSMNLANASDAPSVDLACLRHLLDDVLVDLKADDREAVVLRFFAHRSFAEIGDALRIEEEAARKRVNRALERLRTALSRRGITSTAVALSSALTAAGTTAIPATLSSQVVAIALAQTVVLPAALTTTLMSSLLPAAAIAAVFTGVLTITPQRHANRAMREDLVRLERSVDAAIALRSEVEELARSLALAEKQVSSARASSTPIWALDVSFATKFPATRPGASKISITPGGGLHWDGKAVRLDEFIERLWKGQSPEARRNSQILVEGNGVEFLQLNFVLDEIRKAGIGSLVVDSDCEPDPKVPVTWF